MAINYLTLFTRLGRAVRIDTSLSLAQHNYHAWLEDVLALYAGDERPVVQSLLASKDAFRGTLGGLKSMLKGQVDALWGQAVLELDPPLVTTAPLDCLDAVIADMLEQSEAVDGNTVAITPATAEPANHGDAELVTSIACLTGTDDTAQLNEFLWPERKKVLCTSSAYNTTGLAGTELFQVSGERPVDTVVTGYRLHSGETVSLTALTAATGLLTNADFEAWTGVTPAADGWTIDTGAWGTEFRREATIHMKGSYCLRATGDGGAARMHQDIPIGTLAAGTKYVLGVWLRRSAAVAPGVPDTLGISLHTAAHAFGAGEQIALDQADLTAIPTADWQLHWFFFNTPDVVGDWTDLVLRIDQTMTAGVIVYIDELILAEPTYDTGVFYAMFSGPTACVPGDLWTLETSNGWEGRFQTYAALMYGRMFPSDNWSPYGSTQPDTLIDDFYCWPYSPWSP